MWIHTDKSQLEFQNLINLEQAQKQPAPSHLWCKSSNPYVIKLNKYLLESKVYNAVDFDSHMKRELGDVPKHSCLLFQLMKKSDLIYVEYPSGWILVV